MDQDMETVVAGSEAVNYDKVLQNIKDKVKNVN
jgi:hypothetical protein